MRRLAIATTLIGMSVLAVATPAAALANTDPSGVLAEFEGRTINLSDGWGDAKACFSDDDSTRCYRSEAEMDQTEGEFPSGPDVASRGCSAALRLYRGNSYTGGVLSLSTQYTTLNLASYGFNNATSSYKVGPCAARFYDTTTGGTAYPGNTNAHVSRTAMVTGWDNRIGSVYIL